MHNLSVDTIFSIKSDQDFEHLALKIFHYQAEANNIFRKYLHLIKIDHTTITNLRDIPFLPIDFFKSHKVISGEAAHEKVFFSSGTTGMIRSNHYITDLSVYEKSFLNGFERFYGPVDEFCILALLPTYLENESSSLVYMADKLIRISKHNESGFYLDNNEDLILQIQHLENTKQKTLLLGVSYALLDLSEDFPIQLINTIVMETGGMKGKRKELTKWELHDVLAKGFGTQHIHSEYGMTELLSQAYSKGGGKFYCPPWMKIAIRDTYDPFCLLEPGKSGGINIIDLANINSCSFIETKDLGKLYSDGSFEVTGRFDNSDIRGCNLLVAE